MNSEWIKNTVSLMLITVIAGLLLGVVHEITKEPIKEQRKQAKEEAYKEVFADAASFETISISSSVSDEIRQKGYDADVDEAMKVIDKEGAFSGYVMTITDHEGYGGDIQFAMGVRKDGTLNGISFLTIGETAGLGMKAKEDAFRNQFAGKNAEKFVYTKDGASAENEIDAISGATITTNAVTNGVNAGLTYLELLQ